MLVIGDVVVDKADKISDLVKLTFYRMHRKFMLHLSTFSNQAKTHNYDLFITSNPATMMGK